MLSDVPAQFGILCYHTLVQCFLVPATMILNAPQAYDHSLINAIPVLEFVSFHRDN